jgi:hypothetical protein
LWQTSKSPISGTDAVITRKESDSNKSSNFEAVKHGTDWTGEAMAIAKTEQTGEAMGIAKTEQTNASV